MSNILLYKKIPQHWKGVLIRRTQDSPYEILTPDDTNTYNIVDGDYYEFIVTEDIPNVNIKYTRNLISNNPLYIPFSFNTSDYSDQFEVIDITKLTSNSSFTDITGSIQNIKGLIVNGNKITQVNPNTPYVLMATQTGEITISVQNTTLYKTIETNSLVYNDEIAFRLCGNYCTSQMDPYRWYAVSTRGDLSRSTVKGVLKPFRFRFISDYIVTSSYLIPMYNVGAVDSFDPGLYYQWGNTTGVTKEQFNTGTYKLDSSHYNNVNTITDDVATIKTGLQHIPTKAEWDDAISELDPVANTEISFTYNDKDWKITTNSKGIMVFDVSSSTTTSTTPEIKDSMIDGVGKLIITPESGRNITYNTPFSAIVYKSKINNSQLLLPLFGYADSSEANLIQSYGASGYYWVSDESLTDNATCKEVSVTNNTITEMEVPKYSGNSIRGIVEREKKYDPSNGQEYVDLGITTASGKKLLWAKYNVGATSETDAGLYFQWGDTQGYTADQIKAGEKKFNGDFIDYKYSDQTTASTYSKPNLTKYCNNSDYGYNGFTDNLTTLELSDDAAHINMGGDWRMPTIDEFTELLKNTTVKLIDSDGNEIEHEDWNDSSSGEHEMGQYSWSSYPDDEIKGIKCYNAKNSSKYIFLPASGLCYDGHVYGVGDQGDFWSRSLNPDNYRGGLNLDFDSYGMYSDGNGYRYYGMPVRGVLEI